MSAFWLGAAVAFVALVVVAALTVFRLAVEVRATAVVLTCVAEAAESVRADLLRARTAIDRLGVPSLRQMATDRALAVALRWAVDRVLRV